MSKLRPEVKIEVMIKYSIVYSFHNQTQNISILLDRLSNVINRDDIEIVFVNNASSDITAEQFLSYMDDYDFLKCICLNDYTDDGYGVLYGLKHCEGEFIGWSNSNLETDPADLLRAVQLLEIANEPKNCFVKGKVRTKGFIEKVMNLLVKFNSYLLFGTSLVDISVHPVLFHRDFLWKWESPPKNQLDLYVLYLALKSNLSILRIPVLKPVNISQGSPHKGNVFSEFSNCLTQLSEFKEHLNLKK